MKIRTLRRGKNQEISSFNALLKALWHFFAVTAKRSNTIEHLSKGVDDIYGSNVGVLLKLCKQTIFQMALFQFLPYSTKSFAFCLLKIITEVPKST